MYPDNFTYVPALHIFITSKSSITASIHNSNDISIVLKHAEYFTLFENFNKFN